MEKGREELGNAEAVGISPKLRVGTIKPPSAVTAAEQKSGDLSSVTLKFSLQQRKGTKCKEGKTFPELELENPTQHNVNYSTSPLTLVLVRQGTRDVKTE